MKVLIADDEELVRQLIKRLVNWQSLELEIVAEAENGYQAYDLLVEYVPDIAIVDIRMPGFDGLTLIRKTRELNLNIHFMLISGYKKFEYAHEALTLGVQDYLLKPIRREELTQNLIQIRDSILAENKMQETHARLSSAAEFSSSKLRAHFFKDIVLYQADSSGFTISQVNQEYGFRFSEGVFQFLLCKEHGGYKQKHTMKHHEARLSELFKDALAPLCYDIESYYFNHRLYYLLNYSSEYAIAIRTAIQELFRRIPNTFSPQSCQAFTLAFGISVTQISELSQALSSAQSSLDRRFFLGGGQLLSPITASPTITVEDLINEADERKFFELFDLGDGEHIKKWMLTVLPRAYVYEEAPSVLVALSCRLVDLFFRNANKWCRQSDRVDSSKAGIYESIACADSRNDLAAILSSMVDDWYEINDTTGNVYVRFAKEYIKENYQNDIRLSEIAQAESINPAYLSRIFSEETGETFSDYLIRYRIQIAKELLHNITVNVSEVAEQVGYNDVKHFSASFKKIVGISPKDYRKLHAH